MTSSIDTRLDSDLVERPAFDADAMQGRVAAMLFGSEADPVHIGRFEVIEAIGSGGMGVVHLARDPKLGRNVAVKVLHPTGRATPLARARMLREAQALARLSHPNVVQLYEVGEHAGRVFLAMEYVEGESLRQWQAQEGRSWSTIVDTYVQAARGLAAAHGAGIVHRDFKPSNALVGLDGRVRVVDFGLARTDGVGRDPGLQSSGSHSEASLASADETITRPGARVGTPAYMSPEQLSGLEVDARCDQWSLCVALWEALYGVRPWTTKALRSGLTLPPPAMGRPRGPRSLRVAIERGFALRPKDRWPNMLHLAQAIERATIRRSARTLWVGTAVIALGIGGFHAFSDPSAEPCAQATSELEAVWNASRRERMARALRGDGPAFAGAATEPLLRAIDDYASRWTDSSHNVCEASLVPGSQASSRLPAAISCLARARGRLLSLVQLLERADASVLAQGDALLVALRDPEACVEGLEEAPSEHEVEVLDLIGHAEVLLAAGRTLEAHAIAGVASTAACGLDLPRSRVRSLGVRGRAAAALGGAEAGARDLLDAINLAEAEHLDRDAAELWLALVDVGVLLLRDPVRAATWLERADAAVRRVGSPPLLVADLERLAGNTLAAASDAPGAMMRLATALQTAKALGDRGEAVFERTLLDHGLVALQMGDLATAESSLGAVAKRRRERLGSEHPLLSPVELALGRLAHERGSPEAAREHFGRALAFAESAYGPDSPRLAPALLGLGQSAMAQGDLEVARDVAERAIVLQRDLPVGHVQRGGGLTLLAAIAESHSDHTAAADLYIAAAEEWHRTGDELRRALTNNNAAWHLMAARQFDRAQSLYAWLVANVREGEPLHVIGQAGLGHVDVMQGANERAIARLEAALVVALGLEPAVSGLVPEIRLHLAEALHAEGRDPARVRMLAEEAWSAPDRPVDRPAREAFARLLPDLAPDPASEAKEEATR